MKIAAGVVILAVMKDLCGKRVRLRCVSIDDAGFTLNIRNDEGLTRYIPRVDISYEQQVDWIKKQRDKQNDYFFIIENNNGLPQGTIAFYNILCEEKSCEVGRYISYGTALENVEAAVLILDYVFENGDIKKTIFNIDLNNKKIINFWKKFGAVFNEILDMGEWEAAQYTLDKNDYAARRASIVSLLGVE